MDRSIQHSMFRFKYKLSKSFHWKRKNYFSFLIIIVWILLILLLLWDRLYHKFYSETYQVTTIQYTARSLDMYNNNSFYSFVWLSYACRYYFDIKLFDDSTIYEQDIKNNYPFVESIKIVSFANNTLILDVIFIEPTLRFLYKNELYGAYPKNLLQINQKDWLWSGSPVVLLPIYLNKSSQSISGLLYGIDINKMLYDLLLLKAVPLSWSITYIPWWDKYILWNNDIRIYFNAKKDINAQLILLFILIDQYRWFGSLKQIDVGSLDNPIVR
jgi:hypothetical protein